MRPNDVSQTLGSVPRTSCCVRQRATTMAIGLRALVAASVAALSVGAFAHGAELDQHRCGVGGRHHAPDSRPIRQLPTPS